MIESLVRVDPLTPLAVVVGDTLPVIQVTALDQAGEPVDLADVTVVCILHDREVNEDTEVVAEITGSVVKVPWIEPLVDAEHSFGATLRFTNNGDIRSLPGPRVIVYDPGDLWADPAVVNAMTGGNFTEAEIINAILAAEAVVRAWVTRPIESPVSDRVRLATALIASRALTATATAQGDTASVIGETIGDYSVRYAFPTALGSAGLIVDGSDIADLLAPWNSPSFDVFVGHGSLYPITAQDYVAEWWEWNAIPLPEAPTEPTTVETVPAVVNLHGYAGDTMLVRLNFSDPLFATGSWSADIKQSKTGPVVASFVVSIEDEGTAFLTLDAVTTNALGSFKGYWDVEVVLPGQTVTIVQGKVTLDQDVTN